MAKRVSIDESQLINGSGATKELGPWEITALVGAGACVAAPTAVVLGSLQTTFVVGGAVATAGAVAAHRVANGKDAVPDFFKKKDEDKAPASKNGKAAASAA